MKTKHLLIVCITFFLTACGVAGIASADKPDWWSSQEHVSDKVAESATTAVPLPLSKIQIGGFIERRNLKKRIERFSDASKVGYVYILSFGKFIGYYTIEGKISSTESQMTNTTQVWRQHHSNSETAVDSIGDDGSFGPNEKGIFFFTTGGVMVQTSTDYIYSDAPLKIGDVPQLTK